MDSKAAAATTVFNILTTIVILITILMSHYKILDQIKAQAQAHGAKLAELDTTLQNMEGRIALHEGKGYMTNGQVCVVGEDALAEPEVAITIVNACIKTYWENQ